MSIEYKLKKAKNIRDWHKVGEKKQTLEKQGRLVRYDTIKYDNSRGNSSCWKAGRDG